MRIKKTKSKNTEHYSIIKDIKINGKRTTKIHENLGNIEKIKERAKNQDPLEWLADYVKELNQQEKDDSKKIVLKLSQQKEIKNDKQTVYNVGYLFLQKIYYNLGINKICKEITNKHKFKYDINDILSKLIYSRILYPSSKLSTYKISKKYIEQPKFELHQIYKALSVLAKEDDYIQSQIYKNSLNVYNREKGILYYDCTNYFFEIEEEDGIKQYGVSKEHRPTPIVQMGLFMDADGIPIAFNINKGNTNEQTTLKPLEKKILEDFNLSKFVVCTDAGLSSLENRKFNDIADRAFITTQSIKKLKGHLEEWVLDNDDWKLSTNENNFDVDKTGQIKKYKLDELKKAEEKAIDEEKREEIQDKIYYKERWINENGLSQKILVTYSFKYRKYQEEIRNKQIERAEKYIANNPNKMKKAKSTDYKRFIGNITCTEDGEVAENQTLHIDKEQIKKESKYDGLYAVCTNLEDEAKEIIKVNKKRWEIEECFRIMKHEFKARPVYLNREDRIKAHFLTCFLSLVIFRLLEKQLSEEFTCDKIIEGLKEMNLYEFAGEGYAPMYTKNAFTDKLHNVFGFKTDYEINTNKNIKKIISSTKR